MCTNVHNIIYDECMCTNVHNIIYDECMCTNVHNIIYLYVYVCMNVHVHVLIMYYIVICICMYECTNVHNIIYLYVLSQIEQKTSNKNWMNCRHCKLPFCHQCNEPCFGRYHFNEFGCKEYTTLQEDMIKMKEDEKEDEEG